MKTLTLLVTLWLLLATSVAQKQRPKAPPKKPPPPKAKSYEGKLVFRTYVTGNGHKTEMYVDVLCIAFHRWCSDTLCIDASSIDDTQYLNRRFAPASLKGSYKSWIVQIADMQGQKLPADMKTGSPLTLTGTVLNGTTLRVAKYADVRRPRIARAAMNEVLTGAVKLLVVVLKYPGQNSPVRISRIRTNVLGAVGANFASCSYGQLRLDKKSTIVGPIDVTPPPDGSPPCSADVQGLEESWFAQANAALKARQINPTAWPYILYVLPTNPSLCLVKGWANLRCNGQATSGSDDPACYGAIYSTGANDQTIFLREVGGIHHKTRIITSPSSAGVHAGLH